MNAERFNDLIYLIREGIDKNALNEIYTFYFPKIVKFLFRKYSDRHFAENIAQDFFYKLLVFHDKQFITNPTGWIYTIADNLAKNELKYIHRHCAALTVSTDASAQDENSVFEQILYNEYRKKLNNLDKQTKDIILMFIFEERTHKEIADELFLSHEAVRKKYRRGLRKLQKM